MRSLRSKYIISFLFAALLLFKGTVAVVTILSHSKLPVAELITEGEQEKKESGKTGTIADEKLFGEAILSSDDFVFIPLSSKYTIGPVESLPDVYLDTLTPPPLAG